MAQPTAFGRYLKRQRIEAGLSLREVADSLGLSHVYLGEVERGVRPPMNKSRWPSLVAAIPGVSLDELEDLATRSRSVQLSIADAPPQYQNLALALARRIEKQDLAPNDMQKILRLLRGGDDE